MFGPMDLCLLLSHNTLPAYLLNWMALTYLAAGIHTQLPVINVTSFNLTSKSSVPERYLLNSTLSSHTTRQQPNWRRKRYEVVDLESPSDQDSQCGEFINSVIIPQSVAAVKDPSSSILPGFFNVPKLQKRGDEYRFQTPNYPDYFPHNLECIKIIRAPTKEHRILLNFRGLFELEPEPHCLMDFLEIRDGAFGYSPLLGRYCSRRLPDVGKGLQTTGPFMWLRFRSDASIAHRGFQAVYRFFQTTPGHPLDNVYRFRYRMNLTPGEMWKLDDQFLLDNLHDFPPELHHLAIEASFDVRAPNNTYLFLHVVNVTVPQEFSWSCVPDELLAQNARTQCRSINPLVFATKESKKEYDDMDFVMDKLLIQDPASIIDGRKTIFEFYSHLSISPYVTPCPKVRRFCDRSIGKNKLENNRESDRDFFIRQSRMVIRIIIVSPVQKPTTYGPNRRLRSLGETEAKSNATLGNLRDPRKRQALSLRLPQMPTFHFQVTALKRVRSEFPSAPCEDTWTACDAETCIPKAFWCDKIFNCPQWQDEGTHCEELRNNDNEAHKSLTELRKEQEKREADAEQLAAQTLHLSILGSLGLLLTLITVTCVAMTLRRRKKEQIRHQIKLKENSVQPASSSLRPTSRLNHVMSAGVLLEDNNIGPMLGKGVRAMQKSNHLLKSNSIQGRDRLCEFSIGLDDQKLSNQVNTSWNSTDSVNAPLLWQRKSVPTNSGGGKRLTSNLIGKWNHTTPANLVLKDGIHWVTRKDRDMHPKSETETAITQPTNQAVHSPFRGRHRGVGGQSQTHTVVSVTPTVSLEHHVTSTEDPLQRIPTMARPQAPVIAQGLSSRRVEETGLGTPRHSRRVESVHKLTAGSPSGALWVSGPSTRPMTNVELRDTGRVDVQSKRSPVEQQPKTTVRALYDSQRQSHRATAPQLREKHIANCRLINRTQSWGGGLRLAGVDPICNGKWEVTHSFDYVESPFESTLAPRNKSPTQERKTTRDVKPYAVGALISYTEPGPWRPKMPYVSMPDMNGAIASQYQRNAEDISKEPKSQGFMLSVLDCKPPSAKKPRMTDQPSEAQQWVPTDYVTDSDEELSAGTAIMDDYGSVLSGSAMPEIQENPIRTYSSTGLKMDIGILTVKASAMGSAESPKRLVPRLYIEPNCNTNADSNSPLDLVGGDQVSSSSGGGPFSPGSTVPTSSLSNSNGHSESEDPYRYSRASQNEYSSESDTQSQPHLNLDPLNTRTSPKLFATEQNSMSPNQSPLRESETVFTVRTMIPENKSWFKKASAGSTQRSKSTKDAFVYEYEA
ncbi:hypothetical protein CSKR_104579 [Clonorchis sinensis]|uniref:Uncharacterized protein n=1 Tax=Clonorchis sinensis TaxID=79923 RepID=A0A419PE64_CLOSI|nr:hypothetical protein CSKR_104579 [Clonorchis sinensis]